MTTTLDTDTFVTALRVDDVFADREYQRALDTARCRKMADEWNPRLVGTIEVSDRGDDHRPRYAVMDGQHRWGAAKLIDPPPLLVANVHSGLTIPDEAGLFDKFNRQRKQTTSFDNWRARRLSGDEQVLAIESVVHGYGLDVELAPGDGRIACVSAMETVVKRGGTPLLGETLSLITATWGLRREGLDAAIIGGLSLVLYYLRGPLDLVRLGEALCDVMPRQLRAQAAALKDISPGSNAVLTAQAIVGLYNKLPGRRILVSSKTFAGKPRDPKMVVE